ncbi:MarR family transcriptional regulator [Devosia rhodophyticola]|uniref:MarR family transcriptional regulator n=1 Tax=Devosia rhodophyticola TaxID=3026423 RepID=A0ABY7Z0I3_9HYPH|nr:MarR family transcriptional regulator [Devosia rhodophyticola]WDR07160.1 MarR family transcriptional regulator [Devosia rhodophyticola]
MTDLAEQLREFTRELAIVSRLWRKLARDAIARHGVAEAGAAPLVWIGRLGGDVRQNVLADLCGMESPSLVRIIDDLQAAHLVVRVPDPSDRRANLVSLTPEGEVRLAEIEAVLNQLRDETFAGVSEDDIEAAGRIFAAIRGATNGTQQR